jgi:hypothetical protein
LANTTTKHDDAMTVTSDLADDQPVTDAELDMLEAFLSDLVNTMLSGPERR